MPDSNKPRRQDVHGKSSNEFGILRFHDPVVLDTLGLKDNFLEGDLEQAILRDIENFILEFGVGFTFVARQKRIPIENDDYKIDLLFYNRDIKRLVAIDLKIGKFKLSYIKGRLSRNSVEVFVMNTERRAKHVKVSG